MVEHDPCIHELVAEQAARNPGSAALVAGDVSVSYAELDEAADVLAADLRELGVGPEVVTGICARRSPGMIIGVLAVLKAGGAYTPIDPDSPATRLADRPWGAVLTERSFRARFAGSDLPVVDLDDDRRGRRPAVRTGRAATPGNLAYVIYTSGSTGAPKGVAVEHRSLVSSTRARLDAYPPYRKFLMLSSVAFDSAIAGIFGTLAGGGTLCLPRSGTDGDARALVRLVARHRVDTILALPSLYDLMLESAADGELASLRTVILAGERCPAAVLRRSRLQVPEARLVNEYGPAEGTVWSTAWPAPSGDLAGLDTVPIGRPIDGVTVHLLDERGDPVADGQPGEIHLGGAGLARGYLGRPRDTASAFGPAAGGPPGARMYRTGDRGRRRADGELEFLGRVDRQLKINGFRVEPGEVEQALLKFPGVRQAAVVESPRAPGRALAACVTPPGVGLPALREFLRGRLPEYMIPPDIRPVGSLPLNPNGKVDYPAVREVLATAAPAAAGEPPGTGTEQAVVRVWCDVLGLDSVDRSASFVDLGRSIEAMRVSLRLSQIFAIEVPLLWVYEASTVAELSAWLMATASDADAVAEKWLAAREPVTPRTTTP
ncbi:MAG: non-ribosomal peptide synthetase [Actinoplanes sp.]